MAKIRLSDYPRASLAYDSVSLFIVVFSCENLSSIYSRNFLLLSDRSSLSLRRATSPDFV